MDDVVGLLDALGLDAHQERGEHAPKGSIGRVLDLPGGDLQVREDGPRDTSPSGNPAGNSDFWPGSGYTGG